MTSVRATFVTDTATLCIFDPLALKHRLNDEPDWWSLPEEELCEVNDGAALFIGLGSDGTYEFEVEPGVAFTPEVSANLRCPAGRVFVGAGEEVSGGGLEPDCTRGGLFVTLAPDAYRVGVMRVGRGAVAISFERSSHQRNSFKEPLRLNQGGVA